MNEIETNEETLTVYLNGELNNKTTQDIGSYLSSILSTKPSIKTVILDFRGVTFIDDYGTSFVLACIVAMQNRGTVKAKNIPTFVEQALKLADLYNVLVVQ